MITSIVVNWALGIAIGKKGSNRALLVLAIVFNVLVIGFFKYEGFVAQILNSVTGAELVPNLNLPLPIGISFYTLQALSYVIDVYREEVEPQKNILYLGMYVTCFPQLIAGPIVRYQTIQDQVVGRHENLSDFAEGLRLFMIGFAKKALLANTIAMLGTDLLSGGGRAIGAIGAWGGLLAYTFQIYFDFSGYSDMAIGLGRMMGFTYVRNFNYPYISSSITEFWRRWHISLSSFFRDYIYIPLGGSRCSTARNIANIAVVWAITGLWHGAAWNYVLWGVYYGVLLACEKYLWGKLLARVPRFVGHLYTILVFMFGWSFFWIGDMGVLVEWRKAMALRFGATGTSTFWELAVWEYWPVFIACAVASTPICPVVKERFCAWAEGRSARSIFADGQTANPKMLDATQLCTLSVNATTTAKARCAGVVCVMCDIVLFILFVCSIVSVMAGSFNPFIYFQF